MIFEANLINFAGIKSRSVASLGFLILKPYLTIETTQHKTKNARKALIGENQGAKARKARTARKAHRRLSMMGKTRRYVRHVSVMGQVNRHQAA